LKTRVKLGQVCTDVDLTKIMVEFGYFAVGFIVFAGGLILVWCVG
jgi:hypothetical protein